MADNKETTLMYKLHDTVEDLEEKLIELGYGRKPDNLQLLNMKEQLAYGIKIIDTLLVIDDLTKD